MCQKLTCQLMSKVKDFYGVWEVEVLINGKSYVYPIDSEYIVSEVERLLYSHKLGEAIALLKKSKITGFNSFEEESKDGKISV